MLSINQSLKISDMIKKLNQTVSGAPLSLKNGTTEFMSGRPETIPIYKP